MPWFPPVTTADLGIDDTVEGLRTRGAQLVGEVVQYKDAYRLCYIRGPEELLIGLAEELKDRAAQTVVHLLESRPR